MEAAKRAERAGTSAAAPITYGRITRGQKVRRILNWVNLSTPLGLIAAHATGCRTTSGPWGLILATGYTLAIPKARAFTLGNVILIRGRASEALQQPALLAHESRHSWQYAACLGMPFFPLYFLAAGWSLLRTGNPASGNFFERRAGLHDGGYAEHRTDRIGRN